MSQIQSKLTQQDPKDARFQFLASTSELRGEIQRIRTQWINSLAMDNKKETLFELEMILLGIERFFKEKKSPSEKLGHLITRDFAQEIHILYDSVSKVVFLSETLLNHSDKSFPFRQFVSNKTQASELLEIDFETGINQSSPMDSLYLLNTGFRSYSVLLEGMLQLPMIPLHLFENLGNLISREMNLNRYFNPQQFSQFSPFYDRISSDIVQNFIKSINSDTMRKIISVILLVFFRVIHYLRFIPRPCSEAAQIKKSLIIYSLISSELKNLTIFIENDVPEILKTQGREEGNAIEKIKLLAVLKDIAKQLSGEGDRVFRQELRDFSNEFNRFSKAGNSIEICYSILLNTSQHNVVSLVKIFDDSLNGKDIFEEYYTPFEQSSKLIGDLYLFDKILETFDEAVRKGTHSRVAPVFRCILEFTDYFEMSQFQSLRFKEYERFKIFSTRLWEFWDKLKKKEVSDRDVSSFKDLLRNFRPCIQDTLKGVAKRNELKDFQINDSQIERVLKQYMERFK